MHNNIHDSLIIKGLNQERKLKGTITVNGAKNAALKAMAASVLFDEQVTLKNIPDTDDIHTLVEILKKLGAKIDVVKTIASDGEIPLGLTMTIDCSKLHSTDIDSNLAKNMRASVVLTGPLLARFGKVSFPTPGGCVIGARPIDLFVKGYELMGATTSENSHLYIINSKKNLQASKIHFEKISVGATETLMMSAVLANGTTVLENCAMEPEIVNVAEWLNACGAKISGVGTRTITIEGLNGRLLQAKAEYVAMPDRIEAGSFLFLGVLCAEELIIDNCNPDHLEMVINLLKDSGVHIDARKEEKKIIISKNTNPISSFKSFDIVTKEYPGFPTDLQAPAVVYLTQVNGISHVTETIFEGRFKYVEDLVGMGSNIQNINPHEIKIAGPSMLHELNTGYEFNAHDIRAGFAMILAALVAKGDFKLNNVRLVDRGYEKIEQRLSSLGADITRIRQ